MTDHAKVLVVFSLLTIAFITGRESAPVKTVTETKIVTQVVEKESTSKQIDKNIVVQKITKPDGTKIETMTDKSTYDSVMQESKKDTSISDVKKEVISGSSSVSTQILAAYQSGTITYGLEVSKRVLGPIRVGGFGYKNGMFGISAGLDL